MLCAHDIVSDYHYYGNRWSSGPFGITGGGQFLSFDTRNRVTINTHVFPWMAISDYEKHYVAAIATVMLVRYCL